MGEAVFVTAGEKAKVALAELLRDAKSEDPLAPVTVVSPSMFAALALRRVVAGFNLGPDGSTGLANVNFTTIREVITRLGEGEVSAEGKRPLTRAAASECVRRALEATIGPDDPLAHLASNPNTLRAFERTIGDLSSASEEILDQVVAHVDERSLESAAGRPLASKTVEVCRAYRELRTGYFDLEDLAAAAARRISDPDAIPDGIGAVILYWPRSVDLSEVSVLSALKDRGRLRAVFVLSGDADGDGAILSLAKSIWPEVSGHDRVQVSGSIERAEAPRATRVISAPDAEEEVRIVMREIASAAGAGEHLYRKALLYPDAARYARLVADLFTEAGIPFSGASVESLAETAAGALLAGLMKLAESDLGRDDVARWLHSAPIVDPRTGRAVPGRTWDHLSRRAGIVSGGETWSKALSAFSANCQDALAALDPDADRAKIRAFERDIEEAASLSSFIENLAGGLSPFAPGAVRSWPEFSTHVRSLLDTYTGGESARGNWPEIQLRSFEVIDQELTRLALLEEFGEMAPGEVFARAVLEILTLRAPHERRFGDGVFVGRMADAVASDFESVYIVGMAEGVCPRRLPDDPLIPDEVRIATLASLGALDDYPHSLTLRRDHELAERRDFLGALAAGVRDRVLTHPVGDLSSGRPALPSQWLVEEASWLAAAAGGPRPRAEDLIADAPLGEWHFRPPSFDSSLRDQSQSEASAEEFRLRQISGLFGEGEAILEDEAIRSDPELWRGLAVGISRSDRRATAFSGYVGDVDLALRPDLSSPSSATGFESWATCPHRYFLDKVLRVGSVPKPEAIEEIPALDRGSLIHEILETFHNENLERASSAAYSVDDEDRLLAIAEEAFASREEAGLTGRELFWEIEKSRISLTLIAFLRADEQIRRGWKSTTIGSEVSFGFDGDSDPVFLKTNRGRVALRGRIDRLDQALAGKVAIVIDYKTGSIRSDIGALHKIALSSGGELPDIDDLGATPGTPRTGVRGKKGIEDVVASGRSLQLPLYGMAASRIAAASRVVAFYWHLDRATSASTCYGYEVDESARDRFAEVVGLIAEGISAGVFPARPTSVGQTTSGRSNNCSYCDFTTICPVDVEQIMDAKAAAPEFDQYARLASASSDGGDES